MGKIKKKGDPYAEREAEKYAHPIPSREFILEHLAERGRPATYDQLEAELEINDEERQEGLRRRLIAMVRDGQLLKNRRDAFGPLDQMELIAGRVVGHKDGFGFVVPDQGGGDLFLSPRQMRAVFHGDRVLARAASFNARGKREGVIIEVLEHALQQVVGRFRSASGATYVEPSNLKITQEILIPGEETHGAQEGQIVVAEITSQPTQRTRPIGKVIEVLGDHMAPGMEINVAIRTHSLPNQWPEEALEEAFRFPAHVAEEAIQGRTDFRHLPFVTIDGEDAKDFDDAVYCEPHSSGGFVLYVAIADVAYYVQPGSILDKEAYTRGNSVYFPGQVIPMLPETLSNNLCSLKPDVDRLAMVCAMQLHPSGKVMHYQFYEGVFRSRARLTYKQVHTMMEKKDVRLRGQFKEIVPHLEPLYAVFHVLHEARKKRGAIDFELPETKIIFGKNRKITKIVPYERFISHRVIEEAMLCANICAAKFLEESKQSSLYRVHEGPTEEKLTDLRQFLAEMSLAMPRRKKPEPSDYAHILRVIQDRPDAHMIQTILLRSMSQAIYSPDNKGHFGLAYEAYAHFTSPIRRYPDLLVHRAIKRALAGQAEPDSMAKLVMIGEHCSMTERRADDAVNEAVDWLKCEFMLDKVGKIYQGKISGVTNFGVFVELAEIYVEGLVHITTLPEDYYQFDAIKHVLTGKRSNRRFCLGDPIEIQVARVDLDQRTLDFVLTETLNEQSNKKNKTTNKTNKKNKKNNKISSHPKQAKMKKERNKAGGKNPARRR